MERRKASLSVVALTPASAMLWLELEPDTPDPVERADHVRAYLQTEHRGRLLVALLDGRVVGRLQLHPVGAHGIALLTPQSHHALTHHQMEQVADALLDRTVTLASATYGVRYIEMDTTQPASVWQRVWCAALSRHRFRMVAESRIYIAELERSPGAELRSERSPTAPLTFMSASRLPDQSVEAIYASTYADTKDRAHRHSLESFGARIELIKALPPLIHDPSLWLIAFERGRAVGLVFCGMEDPSAGDANTGWIVELGIVPASRHRGIGTLLLRRGKRLLFERGAHRVKSRVDEDNSPSIHLHLSNDFVLQPGSSQLYQRRLS